LEGWSPRRLPRSRATWLLAPAAETSLEELRGADWEPEAAGVGYKGTSHA
jgi:hypothetical protein